MSHKKNSTNTSRAARRLAKVTDLTYGQALARIRKAGYVPNLDNPYAVSAFLLKTAATSDAPVVVATQRDPKREARELAARVDEAIAEWDATDEVDTDLGVQLSSVGHDVAELLAQCAPLRAKPSEQRQAADLAHELRAAVAYYDQLEEHDTSAVVDIVDQLGPAVRLALETLGVARASCRNCGYEVVPEAGTGTGWTHVESSLKAGGFWCNPEFTPGNVHTAAEPETDTVGRAVPARLLTHADLPPAGTFNPHEILDRWRESLAYDEDTVVFHVGDVYHRTGDRRSSVSGENSSFLVHHACAPDCGRFTAGRAEDCTCGGVEVVADVAPDRGSVFVEPIGLGAGTHGPYPDEVAASLAMDELGLTDATHKIVVRDRGCFTCAGPVDDEGFCVADCTGIVSEVCRHCGDPIHAEDPDAGTWAHDIMVGDETHEAEPAD